MGGPPLTGFRVLELAEGWAGPFAAEILGFLGAEVIKVEAIQRMDHTRGPIVAPPGLDSYPGKRSPERPYDVNAAFVGANRNKRSATIDLGNARGLDAFYRLVEVSDVVHTNMVTGVPEKLGVGYEQLRQVRPDLVYTSVSGFGVTGPYRHRVTMGGAMDGFAGFSWLRHYPDSTPDTASYSTHTDTVTAITAAMAAVMGLYKRAGDGKGLFLEISGVEASIAHLGEIIVDLAMNGRSAVSVGNAKRDEVPHGAYRCRGDDSWIAVSISSDDAWERLVEALGRPAPLAAARWARNAGRAADREAVDAALGAAVADEDGPALMRRLQAAGVPAGIVRTQREMFEDEHFRERGLFQDVDLGPHGVWPLPTSPWIYDGQRMEVREPPPPLGKHNDYAFSELLGLDRAAVDVLRAERVIGEEPLTFEL